MCVGVYILLYVCVYICMHACTGLFQSLSITKSEETKVLVRKQWIVEKKSFFQPIPVVGILQRNLIKTLRGKVKLYIEFV